MCAGVCMHWSAAGPHVYVFVVMYAGHIVAYLLWHIMHCKIVYEQE